MAAPSRMAIRMEQCMAFVIDAQQHHKLRTQSPAVAAQKHTAALSPTQALLHLQRSVGNRAVSQLIQPKFTMTNNPPGTFTSGQQIEGLRGELIKFIKTLSTKHSAEAIIERMKVLAADPGDLGQGTWQGLISYVDDELHELEDENEFQPEDSEEEEEEEKQTGSVSMAPAVRLGTWNLEKLGKSTKAEKRENKKKTALSALDTFAPTVLALQEVTNPEFFMHGTKNKPGIQGMSIPYYSEEGISELKKQRIYSQKQRQDQLGYKPSSEYQMLTGPNFESGTYKENYPLLVNTAQIIGAPTCFTVDIETGKDYPFDPTNSQPIPFSTEQKINRRLVVWKLTLNASEHLLRPLPQRSVPTFEFYLGVIHTSPSIDIKTEVKRALDAAQQISNRDGIPMALVGDWYMQRSAKDIWSDLQGGKLPEWQLVAPQTITNYPSQGEGQKADHGVVDSQAFTNANAFPVVPNTDPLAEISAPNQMPDEQTMRELYTSMGVDHSLVMHDLTINPEYIEQ